MGDVRVSGRACRHEGCSARPVVQWQRRLTVDELEELVRTEVQRREMARLLADPRLPAPVFGPLPTYESTTVAVMACHDHAIDLDAAAQVHGSECIAPHPDHLPGCNCEPEPLPEPVRLGVNAPTVTLPTGWIVPAPSAS